MSKFKLYGEFVAARAGALLLAVIFKAFFQCGEGALDTEAHILACLVGKGVVARPHAGFDRVLEADGQRAEGLLLLNRLMTVWLEVVPGAWVGVL